MAGGRQWYVGHGAGLYGGRYQVARSSTCKGLLRWPRWVAINLDPACDMVKRGGLAGSDSAAVLEALIAGWGWRRQQRMQR